MTNKGIVICRIGWMKEYKGVFDDNRHEIDTLFNGGDYNKKEVGHEALNFYPVNDFVYGYAQGAMNSDNFCDFGKALGLIDRKEINYLNEQDQLNNVDVVFIANNGDSNFIIGWYKDATIYRGYQKLDVKDKRHEVNGVKNYTLKVHKKNVFLIPENERKIFLPSASQVKGFPGQANIYYPLANIKEYEHWNIILPELRKCIDADTLLQESENKLIKFLNTIFPRRKYWLISSNTREDYCFDDMYKNSVIAIGWEYLGDLSLLNSEEIRIKLIEHDNTPSVATLKSGEIVDFYKTMQINDIVLVRKRPHTFAVGTITSNYYHNFEESLNERKVEWLDIPELRIEIGGKLQTTVQNIKDKRLLQKIELHIKKYRNNGMERYTQLLLSNKNLILTGAPGTGKTYLAMEIAKKIANEFEFVQFHPSYDYTDFVEGLRPIQKENQTEIGFELKNGIFKAFCKKALENDDKIYVFIIDEINRGEIAKIFGELFFSIDPSYRGVKGAVKTQYSNLHNSETDFSGKGFYIPENVYIIGTMNDIDRSVESFDFAMRRRFTWCEIKPADSINMLDSLGEYSQLAKDLMTRLNNAITNIPGLNESYHIGPAYFLKLGKDEGGYDGNIQLLWDLHLKSLLSEYLRGNTKKTELLEKLENLFFDTQETK